MRKSATEIGEPYSSVKNWKACADQYPELDKRLSSLGWSHHYEVRDRDDHGYGSLEEFADAIGEPVSKVYKFKEVADDYDPISRQRELSWTHHEEVRNRDDRFDWLKRAEAESWSVAPGRDRPHPI